MIPDGIETAKDLMLRQYAKQIGLEHPSWGKAKCYAQAQSEHPDLAESFPDSEQSPSNMPAYTAPKPGKPASASVSQRLGEILRLPKRVEARKPAKEDSGEVFLVYGSDGTIDHLELG